MKLTNKGLNNRTSTFLLVAIIFLGFIIRLIHGLSYGFANDELSALSRLNFNNLHDLIINGIAVDAHPAFVQMFLFYWTKIFGTGLFAVRLPFILAGTIVIWVTYKTARFWSDNTSSLIAASIISFSGYPILYSELARPYAFGMLFSTLTLYFFSRIFIGKKNSLKNFAGFSICVLASMYTHYFSLFVSGLIYASGLFFLNKKTIRNYLFSFFIILILYLPYLPIFLQQISYKGVGGPGGWLGAPGSTWLWDYFIYIFNGSYLLTFVMGIGLIITLINIFQTKYYRFFLLPAWFLIVFLFGYIYSIVVNPILQFSILLFIYPALIIFISDGLGRLNKVLPATLTIVLIALTTFATTDKSGFFKKQHFGQFDGLVNDFIEWTNDYPKDNTLSIIDVNNEYYIDYYLTPGGLRPDILQLENPFNKKLFLNRINDPDTRYLIFGWSTKAPRPEIYSAIHDHFPVVIEDRIYFNSRITLFARENTSVKSSIPQWNIFIEKKQLDESEAFINQEVEWGSSIKINNIELPDSLNLKIEAKAILSSTDTVKSILVVDALLENGEKLWRGISLSDYFLKDSIYPAYCSQSLPDHTSKIKELKVYIWNNKKQGFNVHELSVKIIIDKEQEVYHHHFY